MFISPKFELYCSHFTFTASPFSESTSKSETSCLRWLKWDLYSQIENKCDTTFSYIYTFYIYRRPTIFNRGRQNCASFHDFDWDGSLRYQIIFLKQAVFFYYYINIYALFSLYLFLLQGKISKDLFCSGNIICSFEVFQHFTKKNYVLLNPHPHDTPCVREEIFIKYISSMSPLSWKL